MIDSSITQEDLISFSRREEGLSKWLRRLAICDIALAAIFFPLSALYKANNDPESLVALPLLFAGAPFFVVHLTGGVFFLRWLRRIIENERKLGPSAFTMKPAYVIWAYVIPFVNLIRPYRLIRLLFDWSDPTELPRPPRREVAAQSYRESPSLERRAPVSWRHPFPLGAWWCVRWVSFILFQIDSKMPEMPVPERVLGQVTLVATAAAAADLAEVILFFMVFRALSARRTERYRRLIASLASD